MPEVTIREQTRSQVKIMWEVLDERGPQDDQWGGPEHDDEKSEADWMNLIVRRIYKINFWNPTKYRKRLIQAAALCVAAIESYDRKHPNHAE